MTHNCPSKKFIKEYKGTLYCAECFWHFWGKDKSAIEALASRGEVEIVNARNYVPYTSVKRKLKKSIQSKNSYT